MSKWMQTDRFDILATLPAGAAPRTPHATLLALRKLLADRLNVVVRSEVSQGPVYVIKGGQVFVIEGTGVRLSQLAGQLSAVPAISRPLERPERPERPERLERLERLERSERVILIASSTFKEDRSCAHY